jgi:head completion protein GPL
MTETTHDALVNQPVPNDKWFPDLNVQDFQELYRVPAAIAPVVMVQQLVLAMAEVNLALADWKAMQQAATPPAGNMAGMQGGALVPIYQEAVFARAYGWLIPMLVTLYFTAEGNELDDEKVTKLGDFENRCTRAMSLLRRMTALTRAQEDANPLARGVAEEAREGSRIRERATGGSMQADIL